MSVGTVARRVRPRTAEELARALRDADAAGSAVVPYGSGTQQYLGNPPSRADLVLETTALDGIVEHTPADLVATAAAGSRFADVAVALARAGQRIPLDPPHAETATIGGLIATNASGPRRQLYGTLRDVLIGTRTALVDGTIVRAGGKVVKNVAGYDLNKLLIGSLGTLGVVVEATFKILPIPPHEEALVARFRQLRSAFDAAIQLAHTSLRPSALDVHDLDGQPTLIVAAAGEREGVRRILDDAAKFARGNGASATEHHAQAEPVLSRTRRVVEEATDAAVVRASVPLDAQHAYCAALKAIAAERGCSCSVAAHAGAGIVRAVVGKAADVQVREATRALIAAASRFEGDAHAERLPEGMRGSFDVWQGEPPGFFLMRRIKEEFDPRRTLNPGRFVGGL